jgi:Flp pilus assembly protein TadB
MIVDGDYAFVLLVLAMLAASGIAVLVVVTPRAARPLSGRAHLEHTALVHDYADALGLDSSLWMLLLCIGPLVGLALGLWWRLPAALTAVLVLIGACALPWLMGFRRETMLQRREDAVVATVKDIKDRLAGTALNQVMRSLGQRPPERLASAMRVLADIDQPLEECLARCAKRSRSALMNRFCVYVIVGLKADSTAFKELLPTTIIPHLEGLLKQQRARRKVLTYQRGVITLMALVLIALFTLLYTLGPAFHDYYGTTMGAVTVLVLVLGYALLVGLVHMVLRTRRRPRWDIDVLNRELAKY